MAAPFELQPIAALLALAVEEAKQATWRTETSPEPDWTMYVGEARCKAHGQPVHYVVAVGPTHADGAFRSDTLICRLPNEQAQAIAAIAREALTKGTA